jgi:hypothetical protein
VTEYFLLLLPFSQLFLGWSASFFSSNLKQFSLNLSTLKILTSYSKYEHTKSMVTRTKKQAKNKTVYFKGVEYTVKKGWGFSRPQPGCHLPNSPDRE